MAKKKFRAESGRLLDLMINSVYTHKEIFLRELISNASDAIDKLYYKILTEKITGVSKKDFIIRIALNENERTITISDNGIGMTKEELEDNLGTIAKSGSLLFKNEEATEKAAGKIDIIGQFGVGFYSAFMVSERIRVVSKAYGEEQAWVWESVGADGYSVNECGKSDVGTVITLTLKEDTADEKYSEYLSAWRVKSLIKRYSDYIRYPIKMETEKSRKIDLPEGAPEGAEPAFEKYTEDEILNSMVPLWKRQRGKITEEEYADFYKGKFGDFEDPLKVIHTGVEGVISYDALLFIPARAPYGYYTKNYEKGLQLYSSNVMIMDRAGDLIPDYFSFIRGVVDSQDLSLNISREMLQNDRQMKAIAQRLEKKIKSELETMLGSEREKYETFWEAFGLPVKFGLYEGYGKAKDVLKDLVLYYSSSEKKLVTFGEYVSRMPEEQKYIYYATGESIEKIDKMPQTELLKDKGYEILYGADQVDEFALKMMREYEGKEFKSVSEGDLGLEESEDDKKKAEKKAEKYADLLSEIKKTLGEKVTDVRLSKRLKSHPVVLVSEGGLSLEMEKILKQMPGAEAELIKAERILEINADHPVLKALGKIYENDKKQIKEYADILYDQALLMEGLPIEDPVAFSNAVCKLIQKTIS